MVEKLLTHHCRNLLTPFVGSKHFTCSQVCQKEEFELPLKDVMAFLPPPALAHGCS